MDREQKNSEKPTTPKEFATIIKQTPIVVIKMSAGWCGPCNDPKFLESYHKLKLSHSQNKNVKFIEFDVEHDAEIIEDTKYYNIEVNAIPTFLISKNGSFSRKYEGGGYLNEINSFIYDHHQ